MVLPNSINKSIQLSAALNLQVLCMPSEVRKNIHLLHRRPRLLIKSHEEQPCNTVHLSGACASFFFFQNYPGQNQSKARSLLKTHTWFTGDELRVIPFTRFGSYYRPARVSVGKCHNLHIRNRFIFILKWVHGIILLTYTLYFPIMTSGSLYLTVSM